MNLSAFISSLSEEEKEEAYALLCTWKNKDNKEKAHDYYLLPSEYNMIQVGERMGAIMSIRERNPGMGLALAREITLLTNPRIKNV